MLWEEISQFPSIESTDGCEPNDNNTILHTRYMKVGWQETEEHPGSPLPQRSSRACICPSGGRVGITESRPRGPEEPSALCSAQHGVHPLPGPTLLLAGTGAGLVSLSSWPREEAVEATQSPFHRWQMQSGTCPGAQSQSVQSQDSALRHLPTLCLRHRRQPWLLCGAPTVCSRKEQRASQEGLWNSEDASMFSGARGEEWERTHGDRLILSLDRSREGMTQSIKITGTSLVGQWLRLHAPKAGDPGSTPGQGIRSHMPHATESSSAATKRFWMLKLKIPQWRLKIRELQLRPAK